MPKPITYTFLRTGTGRKVHLWPRNDPIYEWYTTCEGGFALCTMYVKVPVDKPPSDSELCRNCEAKRPGYEARCRAEAKREGP